MRGRGYGILSRRLEVPPGPITVVTQLQSPPFGTCAGTISGSCACAWPGLACEGSGPEPLPSGDRCEIGYRGVDDDVAATKRELAACAGQLHGHWREAGMVTRDQPRDDGWAVVLRRQPARIMNGRPQGPAARQSGGRTGSVSSPPDG